MNLYWLVELDDSDTALRTLAVVGQDNECRAFRPLVDRTGVTGQDPLEASLPDLAVVAVRVDLNAVVTWSGHRLGLLPVVAPPMTDNLEEAVDMLAARIAVVGECA